MRRCTVRFLWREPHIPGSFECGVCLHGHTMHSEENLAFVPRYLRHVPVVSQIVDYHERVRRTDFSRAWWTPPHSPSSAFNLERDQIANHGLRPMVSLTDHDNIQAGLALAIAMPLDEIPLSVEWTVPYARSIFHLGVHNIPRKRSPEWMGAMISYTAAPRDGALPGLLEEIARVPQTLIVLNHPYWLEEGVNVKDHPVALEAILKTCIGWLHAFELNGTRRWKENAAVIDLASRHSRPTISGGDRHACEPSACLNLTNARSFAEFTAEIRDGRSSILFMPQYREPMAQRLLAASWEILRTYPEYPGRERWPNRIFYRRDNGAAHTLAQIWGNREPRLLKAAVATVQFIAGGQFRPALRLFLSEREELHP
jgi:hypothetical protein